MKNFARFSFILLSLCCTSLTAAAHLRLQPAGSIDAARISNPSAAQGDIVLPMPGGLSMILRAVWLPASGFLDETELNHGIGTQLTGNAVYVEQRYRAVMTAPFTMKDVPLAWPQETRAWLAAEAERAAGKSVVPYMYFIGKYEISKGQWRSVMEPGSYVPQPGDDHPVTGISWFDAQEFTRRYSEWLLQHHPDNLPVFKQENRSSFIRLPTESEWEYAARGGHRVPPSERERATLYAGIPDASMRDHIVAAVYDATLHDAAPIGSRRPNPLGIHDMLGNCAEMIQTPFQLVAAGQLVGGYGGFLLKGGSWRAGTAEELHPGRRVEVACYVGQHAHTRDDMGFRIALGSILSPKDREQALLRESQEKQRPQTPQTEQGGSDVRVVIKEIIREVDSPRLVQRLHEAERRVADLRNRAPEQAVREVIKEVDNPETLRRLRLLEQDLRDYQSLAATNKAIRQELAEMEEKRRNLVLRLQEADQVSSRYHALVNANEERMMRELVLGAAFSLETIANYGARCFQLVRHLGAYRALLEETHDGKRPAEEAAAKEKETEKEIAKFIESIRNALFYYRGMLVTASRYAPERLGPQLEKVALQFNHDDGFSRSMSRRMKVLREHLSLRHTALPDEVRTLREILPEWLLRELRPYWKK